MRYFFRNFFFWGGLTILGSGLIIFSLPSCTGLNRKVANPATTVVKIVQSGLFSTGAFFERHLGTNNPFNQSWKNAAIKKHLGSKPTSRPCKKGRKGCTQKSAASKQSTKASISYRNVTKKHDQFLHKQGIRIDRSGHIFVDPRKARKVRVIGLSGRATVGRKVLRGGRRRGKRKKGSKGDLGRSNAMIIDSKGNVFVLDPKKN